MVVPCLSSKFSLKMMIMMMTWALSARGYRVLRWIFVKEKYLYFYLGIYKS